MVLDGFKSVLIQLVAAPAEGASLPRLPQQWLSFIFTLTEGGLPVSYSIDPNQKLVTTRIWGAITNDEVSQFNRQLRTDPLFDPTYNQLADMSDVTVNMITRDNVQETARDQYFAPGTRRALVVSDDTTFGLCRMYATYAETLGQVVTVFRDRAEAEAWLGL